MDLISLVIFATVLILFLWLAVPMTPNTKKVLTIVVIVLLIIWFLAIISVLPTFRTIHIGR